MRVPFRWDKMIKLWVLHWDCFLFQRLGILAGPGSWCDAGGALPQAEEGWAFRPTGMVGLGFLEGRRRGLWY